MNHKTVNIGLIILSVTLLTCNHIKHKELKFALNYAGENKEELKKVLEHYKDNPEKLNAAHFLIKNMTCY